HRHGKFRRQHDVLAAVAEDLAETGLRASLVAVDVGGVEQGDAEIERLVDDLARGFEIDAPAEIVAAETDAGYEQARSAKIALFHDGVSFPGKTARSVDERARVMLQMVVDEAGDEIIGMVV